MGAEVYTNISTFITMNFYSSPTSDSYQSVTLKILPLITRNLFGVFGKRVDISRKMSGSYEEKAEGGWVYGANSLIRNLVAVILHHV